MTPTITSTKNLDADALKLLADQTGPCISLVIPDHHPGAPEGSGRTILRNLLKNAQEQLAASGLAARAKSLLEPLEQIAEHTAFQAGGRGWGIFRATDFLACYRVPAREAKLSIASHFLLTPFIAEALAPAEVVVLGLSTKHLRLFEYSHADCREIALPEGIPPSLEAAGRLDRSDRNLENRSPAGSSLGNMHHVRFGTMSEREASDVHLHDFFGIVDRGLKPLIKGRPLLLMGVQEEIAAYRRAAGDGNSLFSGGPGNIEFLSPSEIGDRAREVIQSEYFRRGDAVLAELIRMRDRQRVATDAAAVLRAATEGRVHRLCVRAESHLASSIGGEDLVNAAVVETLRTSGEVFVLEQGRLPATQPVAAILRY